MECLIGRALVPLLLACGIWTQANAEENCALHKLPKDSAVIQIHGGFFFVYPRSITSEYTGCQTTWNELGMKYWVMKFSGGRLTDLWVAAESDTSQPHTCAYRGGVLSGDSPKECPEYDAVKNGVGTDPPNEEPPVPKERDPRVSD
jgi:hypothetical protein